MLQQRPSSPVCSVRGYMAIAGLPGNEILLNSTKPFLIRSICILNASRDLGTLVCWPNWSLADGIINIVWRLTHAVSLQQVTCQRRVPASGERQRHVETRKRVKCALLSPVLPSLKVLRFKSLLWFLLWAVRFPMGLTSRQKPWHNVFLRFPKLSFLISASWCLAAFPFAFF